MKTILYWIRTFYALWRLVRFVEKHQADYSMRPSIYFGSVTDWVVDLTPGKKHPCARRYGEWIRTTAGNLGHAMLWAVRQAEESLQARERENG